MLPKVLDHMSPAEEGLGFGLVRTTYMVFGASGSVGVGLLADTVGWAGTFLTLSGVLGLVLVALTATALRRRLRSDVSPTETPS
jgi:sugar phosphate permease